MPGVDYGARTPDMNSVSMWCGPGAGSFIAAAGVLTGVAGSLSGLLAAHGGVAAQTGVSWMGVTGTTAVAAQTPYMGWLGSTIALLGTSAAQIEATAAAFETARAATPSPGEVAENQSEHVALNAANFMGFLTPAIVANRTRYFGDLWIRGAGGPYAYTAASATGVGALPPIEPPPPVAAPASVSPGLGSGMGADKSIQAAIAGADGAGMDKMMPILQNIMGAPQQLQGLTSGGPLKSITELPQKGMEQLMSMFGQFSGGNMPGMGGADGAGNWITAPPASGGPVAASTGGAPMGGGLGGGLSSAMSPLRAPGAWSSTMNASAGGLGESAVASRFAEARANLQPVSSAGGMGGTGAMGMAPAAAGHGKDSERAKSNSLDDAAILYRELEGIPVVSGAAGAEYSREGAA